MMSSLNELIEQLSRFDQLNDAQRAECVARADRLIIASDEHLLLLLDFLAQEARQAGSSPHAADRGPQYISIVTKLAERLWAGQQGVPFSSGTIARLQSVYTELPTENRFRHHFLGALAKEGSEAALSALVELIAESPPAEHADLAFVPLFQRPTPAVVGMFPQLLDHLADPATATLILDLANFLTRRQLVEHHPAHDRAGRLAALFGGLIDRLKKLEETPEEFASTAAELSNTVSESIALSIALCDALALIGDADVAAQLHKALDISHRRLRTEAAAALAQLGESAGFDALVQLAVEPASRTRALAYLEELGQLNRVDDEYQSSAARGEGDLSEWLSQSTQFGAPPQSLELIDTSRQFWPGFNEQVECFLLRYTYRLPQGDLCGIGIAGPVTHSFDADLEDYPMGDILAAYAGWQAEHPDIQETDADDLAPELVLEGNQTADRLHAGDFRQPRLIKMGSFFGERIFVYRAVRAEQAGVAVVDQRRIEWFPAGASRRPLTPDLAYCMHTGRKILATFNPQHSEEPNEP